MEVVTIKDRIGSLESELELLKEQGKKLYQEKATMLAETMLAGGEEYEVVKDIDHRLESVSRQIANNKAALPVLREKLAQAEKAVRITEMARKGVSYFTAQENMFVVAAEAPKLLEKASKDLARLVKSAEEFKDLEGLALSLYDELFHFMDREAVDQLSSEVTKDSLIAKRLEAKQRSQEVLEFVNQVVKLQWENHLRIASGFFRPSTNIACYQDPRVLPAAEIREKTPAAKFEESRMGKIMGIGDR